MAEAVNTQTGELVAFESPQGLAKFEGETGIANAHIIAKQLDSVIRDRKLAVQIGQGEHLRIEAWCCLASLVGVSPLTAWTKEVRNPDTGELEGYEARVEVIKASTGQTIGAAECGCYTDENRWANAERHAIKSMAQTRATSKALGQILRFIPVLAGYSGTPAEEMVSARAVTPPPAPVPGVPSTVVPEVFPPEPGLASAFDRDNWEDAPVVDTTLGPQDVQTQGEPFGETATVDSPISEKQANRALVIAGVRAKEIGEKHASTIVNSVLVAAGIPAAAHKSSRDEILLHLCLYVTWKRKAYENFVSSIESWIPPTGTAEVEVPF